jgi:hypothetical protein
MNSLPILYLELNCCSFECMLKEGHQLIYLDFIVSLLNYYASYTYIYKKFVSEMIDNI